LEIVIFGAPNAGKSSLLNYLSKSDVAIVSDIEGTTRDIIEVNLDIAGFAVKIIDTAGIRNTNNEIEKEGVKRALKKIDNCDIKIFIFDSSNPDFSEFFKKLDFKVFDQNSIILKNKIDLLENKKTDKFNEFFKKNIKDFDEKSILEISIKKNINLDQIFDLIKNKIEKNIPSTYQPFITNERYRVALKNIILDLENFSLKKEIELASEDLRFAAREIGKINGKVDIENILDVIFSNFCIGK
jgi:tRNA modification GTPase